MRPGTRSAMLRIGAQLIRLEESIAANDKFVFTLLSCLMIPIISLNSTFLQSPFIGIGASVVYILINSTFLGYAFFRKESPFLIFALGAIMFTMLLGLIGWMTMIAWNLDITRSAIVLFFVTIISSIIGLIGKYQPRDFNADRKGNRQPISKQSRIISASYLLLIGIALYLLFISRSGEVRTVWEVLNPLFMPVYFSATFLLLSVIFSRGSVEKKLLFIMIHGILSHSLFVTIFPAGDIGAQMLTLGRIRLVYENISINGWPVSLPPTSNAFSRIYYWFRGINFQTALSVMFARILAVDILWTHIWLVPLLWGTFVPLAAFLTSRALGIGQRASLLAGLLVSLCPNTIYYGAVSVSNSLGFMFFFLSLYFALRYLHNGRKALFLLLVSSFFSLLAHFLAGVMSLSLLFMVTTLRQYVVERRKSPKTVKALWCVTLAFCASLLPLFVVYQKVLFPFYAYFSLDKLNGLSIVDTMSLILFGGYLNFSVYGALLNVAAALLGLFVMIYCLISKVEMSSGRSFRLGFLFLFSGFLLTLVDYRVLKVFMVGVPFNEERIWLFRDFLAVPFLALFVDKVIEYLPEKMKTLRIRRFSSFRTPNVKINPNSVITYILITIALSAWIATSFFYGYPHFAPLQITSYEIEAVKHIEANTPERYVVIADLWMLLAGHAIVGVTNPHSYYFSSYNPEGVSLYLEMKSNPTNDTMISAMKYNNATTAYFIIDKPRTGTEAYNRIISLAQQNNLETYKVFYYQGEERLRIFYYRRS